MTMNIITDTIPELTMGQKLKMFRDINNLSQEQLGHKLNVTDKTISAWENGEREINLSNAKAICELFDIPNSFFVFNENFKSINISLQTQIRNYLKNLEFTNKVDTIIQNCKKKLTADGLPVKKEYLPTFNYDENMFTQFGLFDENSLPIKIRANEPGRNSNGKQTYSIEFENDLNNLSRYNYSSEKLITNGLLDILSRFNSEKVEFKDLINCNNLDVFKTVLEKMKNKKFTKRNLYRPFEAPTDISSQYVEDQLNYVLENLNPTISKYWEIIVFLIDNGAYYSKLYGYGSDVTCFEDVKDISKTNLIYRIAKDKITK